MMSELDYEKARAEAQRFSIDLALRLLDMRRDVELRKARTYLIFELEPTVDAVSSAFAGQTTENAVKARQGFSFWDQIAGVLLHSLGGYDLPTVLSANQEMFILYAKFESIIPELEQKIGYKLMHNISELVRCSEEAKDCMGRAREFIAKQAELRK